MTKVPRIIQISFIFLILFTVKIGIFYTIFYAALAALVAICMWVFFQTLDPRIPKWKLKESLIGTNPGSLQTFTFDHHETEHDRMKNHLI